MILVASFIQFTIHKKKNEREWKDKKRENVSNVDHQR